ETLAQARDERAQRDVERAHLTSNLEHIAASCQSELGEEIAEICARLDEASDNQAQPVTTLSLSTEADEADTEESVIAESQGEWRLLDVPADFDLAAAKARIDQLRTKVDNLGPVNLMAIDELREVEQRLAFLVSQKADIELAVTDLQSAIAEIKRRSRERFAEAFQIINRNFGEMFTELFGGGHGEMRLIDETDILESGIDIIAQPPGKRLQNVLLLSGGEKAMAALALVMAIFKYRPSPFCLLDEVDAPLDEANVGRFGEVLREFATRSQFIIITHNRGTMEVADTLFGVTMQEPGVSTVLSLRLAEAVAAVEPAR
ncbi:MAG: chromosome segregation protein SMC, partial [Chloroflexota bacterium]